MASVHLELVGSPRVLSDGRECTPGPKALALLTYLLLSDRPVGRPEIMELFWPDVDQSKARRTLRSTLSAIRANVSGDLIVAESDMLSRNPSATITTDIDLLEAIANSGMAMEASWNHAAPPRYLVQRFMAGVPTGDSPELDDWLSRMQTRVELLQNQANVRIISELLDGGDTDSAYALACAWHGRDRTDEDATMSRMQCAAALSRTADIRAAFAEHQMALGDDEPTSEVIEYFRALTGDRGVGQNSSGDRGPADVRLTARLPVTTDRFVGREQEIDDLRREIAIHRLLTIWAPGGAGKTRLAVELGSRLAPDFPDGVWFVALGESESAPLVADLIATTLGVWREQHVDLVDTIAGFVAVRQLVLILDNCEHVRDECARIVSALLPSIGESRIVATSREPLGVAGERVHRLQPLALPERATLAGEIDELFESPAVELFVDRATAYDPDFVLDDETGEAVVAICRRLDGFPLALEIAASSLRTLSVHEVARVLDDRFTELTRASTDQRRAHSTIHEVIDWSYRLLSYRAQTLFARLSVFPASFSLEAVESVCAGTGEGDDIDPRAVLSLLDELVRKSLVVVRRDEQRSRYSLYQLVRVFAARRLAESGESEHLRIRLLEWVVDLGATVADLTFGPGRPEPELEEHRERALLFASELPSIRASMEFAIAHRRVNDGLHIATDFETYWWSENRTAELVGYLKRLLPESRTADRWLRASAYALAAAHARGLGEESPLEYIRACRAIVESDDPSEADRADYATRTKLSLLYWIASLVGDDQWRSHVERSVALGRTLRPHGRLQSFVRAANVLERHGEHAEAERLIREAEELGVADHEYFTLRGHWYAYQGRWEEATDALLSGLRAAAEATYWFPGALAALVGTTMNLLSSRRYTAALLGFAAWGLRVAWESGERGTVYSNTARMVKSYIALGEDSQALRVQGFRSAMRRRQPPSLQRRADEFDAAFPLPEISPPPDPAVVAQETAVGRSLNGQAVSELGMRDAFRHAESDNASRVWLDALLAASQRVGR